MPNNFLDISGKHDRIIKKSVDAPAQGLRFIGGDVGQKMVYPALTGALLTSSVSTTPLPAKKGIAYYIHSISIAIAIDADDPTTCVYVSVANPSGSVNLCRVNTLASTVAVYNVTHQCDVTTETGAAVFYGTNGGSPTALPYVVVTYAEVMADGS